MPTPIERYQSIVRTKINSLQMDNQNLAERVKTRKAELEVSMEALASLEACIQVNNDLINSMKEDYNLDDQGHPRE